LRALKCSLAWIHYGAHGLEKVHSLLHSSLQEQLTLCVCVCFCGWNSILSRWFVIRITNLCVIVELFGKLSESNQTHFKGLDSHEDFGSSSSPSFHFLNKFVHENRLSLKGWGSLPYNNHI
jgi:hypothetical protein